MSYSISKSTLLDESAFEEWIVRNGISEYERDRLIDIIYQLEEDAFQAGRDFEQE